MKDRRAAILDMGTQALETLWVLRVRWGPLVRKVRRDLQVLLVWPHLLEGIRAQSWDMVMALWNNLESVLGEWAVDWNKLALERCHKCWELDMKGLVGTWA